MKQVEFLDNMQRARADWLALLAQIGTERMNEPCLSGEWSGKDLIAHMAWFEREMVGVITQRALVGSDLWLLPFDERNAAIYRQNRHRGLDEVVAEEAEIYRQFAAALETLSDQDMVDPACFRDMPPDWVPWEIFAQSGFEHYEQHAPDIVAWLEARSG